MSMKKPVSTGPIAWVAADVPDLTGRTALITGASSGLGLVVARELAGHGADVVMAVRDPEKGERVRRGLLAEDLAGKLEVRTPDLLDLDSVRRFAGSLSENGRALDVLVNNAGISNAPERRLSPQGYESQFATNHLGHFTLTGLLLEALERGRKPRVMTVTSGFYRRAGGIDFDNLQGEKRYSPFGAYVRSKLANTLFGVELERRLRAAGSAVRSLVSHPGVASTPLQRSANSPVERLLAKAVNLLLARSAEQGALPILYAATALDAEPGVFIGPTGPKRRTRISLYDPAGPATDAQAAARLWGVSEDLSVVRYLDG